MFLKTLCIIALFMAPPVLVFAADPNSGSPQGAKIEFQADKYYRVQNGSKILDSSGTKEADKPVRLYNNIQNANLEWQFVSTSGGYYKIKNRSNGFVVNGGNIRQEGIEAIQATNGYAAQYQWQLIPTGEAATYKIQNRLNRLMLAAQDGKVTQVENGDSPTLLWKIFVSQ